MKKILASVVFGTLLFILLLSVIIVVTNNHITRLTFAFNAPSYSEKHSELISEYKVACKQAVETAMNTNVTIDYIRCAYTGTESGMYYYCLLQNGSCYKFRVDAADSIYQNIIYGTSIGKVEVPNLQLIKSSWRIASLVES